MKTNILKITALLGIIAGCVLACNDPKPQPPVNIPEDTTEINNLQGTKWKLIGIVDEQTGYLKELEPKDCEVCYTIEFYTDSTCGGRITTNIIVGNYEFDYQTNTFHISLRVITEAGDWGDGHMYRQIIERPFLFFTVKDTYPRTLHLYHDDSKNYLKYKKIGG